MLYRVTRAYRGGEHGPWVEGQTVELAPGDAAWVNRDSPGTLEEAGAPKEPAWKPEHDRMVRKAASRGLGGPQAKIAKDVFKAVKAKGD